ncbi:hypothetical protein, partial [Herbaspirillum chlorophenolicum]
MIFKKKSVLVLLFLMNSHAIGETLNSKDEVRNFTDEVMGSIAADNLGGAFKQIREYASVSAADVGAMEAQLNIQFPTLISRYGEPSGFEFIDLKTVGSSLLEIVYIAKYEKHAMPWRFYFYKTNKG